MEDNGEVVDEGDAESNDPNEEMINQARSRGKGRPTLLKMEKPAGSRKVYQPSETSHQDPKTSHQNPKIPNEILVRDDVEL